jgi:hypothetical protein
MRPADQDEVRPGRHWFGGASGLGPRPGAAKGNGLVTVVERSVSRYYRVPLVRVFPAGGILPGRGRGTRSGSSFHRRRSQPCASQVKIVIVFEKAPRQDSNLRTRLRRALPCLDLTSANVSWGASLGHQRGVLRSSVLLTAWRVSTASLGRSSAGAQPSVPVRLSGAGADWGFGPAASTG